MPKDLLGQHPRRIFFDDIRMKNLVDILPELSVFEHEYCRIEMFGSVENLITDFQDLYKIIQDKKDVIAHKNKEIRIWITRTNFLEYQLLNLAQMNDQLIGANKRMEYTFMDAEHKMKKLEKSMNKLMKKIRKSKKSSRLQLWWNKTWEKFQIVENELISKEKPLR